MLQVRYTLSMPRPESHLFHVRMEVQGAPPGDLDFVMPSWTPGSYEIMDFARHVQDFDAGRRAWRKIDKARWRVSAAAGGGGNVAIEYRVWAFELGVHTSHLDGEHGFLNGANVFFYLDGHKDAPVRLEIRAPRGWKVATGLERRGRLFTAPEYDTLVDCPIEIGACRTRTFRVRNVPHHLVIHGAGNFDEDRLVRDVEKIVRTEIAVMRHVPYKDYTFILHNAPGRGGGLEHANSTALQVGAAQYRPREKYDDFLELVAHEFWHLWNVKRIRPEMLGPFDYEREVYTTLLWAMEGLTSYYDTLLLCRARLIPPDRYFKRMAERIRKFEMKPGRKRQPLSRASFDSWINLYHPNENAVNAQMSYYEKGQLVGMCLDLEIRRRTEGRASLDDVMRFLHGKYGRRGRGFPEPEFKRACEQAAGGNLDRFFADYVDGTVEVPWNRFLAAAGLRLAKEPKKPEEGETLRRERAWAGIGLRREGGLVTIATVTEDSPADRAGLSVRDELVALDGAKIPPEDWEKRLDDRAPGDRARFTVFRAGRLCEVPVVLGRTPDLNWTFRKVEAPRSVEKRIYEDWLGVPWK